MKASKKEPHGVALIEEVQLLCVLLSEELGALMRQLEQFNIEIATMGRTIEMARKAPVIPFPRRDC